LYWPALIWVKAKTSRYEYVPIRRDGACYEQGRAETRRRDTQACATYVARGRQPEGPRGRVRGACPRAAGVRGTPGGGALAQPHGGASGSWRNRGAGRGSRTAGEPGRVSRADRPGGSPGGADDEAAGARTPSPRLGPRRTGPVRPIQRIDR